MRRGYESRAVYALEKLITDFSSAFLKPHAAFFRKRRHIAVKNFKLHTERRAKIFNKIFVSVGFFPSYSVVDMSRLLTESEPGKAGMAFLEGLQGEMQNKLNAVQERLEKNDKDEEAQRELQLSYMTFQTRMGKEQQNVAGQLYDMLQKVLGEYRAAHGYQIIISREVVASFDAAVDVTAAVLAEVNKQKMTFTPLEQDDAVSAAEKPASQAAPAADKPAE